MTRFGDSGWRIKKAVVLSPLTKFCCNHQHQAFKMLSGTVPPPPLPLDIECPEDCNITQFSYYSVYNYDKHCINMTVGHKKYQLPKSTI